MVPKILRRTKDGMIRLGFCSFIIHHGQQQNRTRISYRMKESSAPLIDEVTRWYFGLFLFGERRLECMLKEALVVIPLQAGEIVFVMRSFDIQQLFNVTSPTDSV